MYKNLELLNSVTHKDYCVKELKSFSFAKDLMSIPVVVSEFVDVCKSYPIVFAKDEQDKWFATAVLGYKQGENLFVDKKGQWEKGRYIPAFVRRYPFIYTMQDDQQLLVAVDKDAITNVRGDAKRRMFDEKSGEKTEFLDNMLKFLHSYHQDGIITGNIISKLDSMGLLEENVAKIVNNKKEEYTLNKLYIIKEDKLNALSEEQKAELLKNNLYFVIHAHLISLSNLNLLSHK